MRAPDGRLARSGFTLVEVMVALALSGLVLLGAHAMLAQLGDQGDAVAASAAQADHEANADRVLRALLENAEFGVDEGRIFRGDARAARFSSWCDSARGWLERCDATLGLIRVDSTNVLAIQTAGEDPLPVRRGFAGGRLLYLSSPADGGAWVPEWTSRLAVPWAVGVVLDGDTLILAIGDRR